jgi:hypothetical protein
MLNSTDAITLINSLVKKVYGMPLFHKWFTWGSDRTLVNTNNDSPLPETDFLFPQTFGDFFDFQKWPLIVMHVVAWLWAGIDNRCGSYICRKAGVRTPWLLKAFNPIHFSSETVKSCLNMTP